MSINHKNEQWVFYRDTEAKESNPGITRRILAYCNNAMCVENRFEKGAVGPVHSHPHTQITYVAEGSFRFTIGNTEKVVFKGDTLCKQDGVEHGCVCIEEGVLIDFFNPMREDFII